MTTVLITGATGFLGRNITDRLKGRPGLTLRLGTRNPPRGKNEPGLEYVKTDFADPASLLSAVTGADAVIHLAAAVAATKYEEFERANVLATRALAAACSKENGTVKTFILASSLAAAGASPDPDKPRTEDQPETPVSHYGMTKLAAEKEIENLPAGIARVILRPAFVYGRNDPGIDTLAEWVRRGIMISAGSADTRFSFIFVEDAAACFITALDNADKLDRRKFFICEPTTYSWEDFVRAIAISMRKPVPVLATLPFSVVKAVGELYGRVADMVGLKPVFNADKAREANAGNWIASPASWMKATGQTEWTKLSAGLAKTFSK